MSFENLGLAFAAAFAVLALVALHGWGTSRSRVSVLRGINDELRAENAALRKQVNRRGEGGRFVKRSAS